MFGWQNGMEKRVFGRFKDVWFANRHGECTLASVWIKTGVVMCSVGVGVCAGRALVQPIEIHDVGRLVAQEAEDSGLLL